MPKYKSISTRKLKRSIFQNSISVRVSWSVQTKHVLTDTNDSGIGKVSRQTSFIASFNAFIVNSLICFKIWVPSHPLSAKFIMMICVFDVIPKICIVYKHGCEFCNFVNLFLTKIKDWIGKNDFLTETRKHYKSRYVFFLGACSVLLSFIQLVFT